MVRANEGAFKMKFQNLKIAITDEVHLKAVCDVLESMGYRWCNDAKHNKPTKHIITFSDGLFDYFYGGCRWYDLTTLTDLLRMRDNQIKEAINAK